VYHECRKTRANASFTKQWKKNLRAFPDNEIFSPRIKAIIETIRTIATDFPGEGIVIISSSVLFLDIILESISRLSQTESIFQFKVSEFNGTLKVHQRAEIISEFNKATGQTRVLLASSGVGGTGVNMHGASHLILTAPFWTPGEREQAKGRVHRLGQKRKVYIGSLSLRASCFARRASETIESSRRTIATDPYKKAKQTMSPEEWNDLILQTRRQFVLDKFFNGLNVSHQIGRHGSRQLRLLQMRLKGALGK
jgi:superfamily II DNA or RNA helicase